MARLPSFCKFITQAPERDQPTGATEFSRVDQVPVVWGPLMPDGSKCAVWSDPTEFSRVDQAQVVWGPLMPDGSRYGVWSDPANQRHDDDDTILISHELLRKRVLNLPSEQLESMPTQVLDMLHVIRDQQQADDSRLQLMARQIQDLPQWDQLPEEVRDLVLCYVGVPANQEQQRGTRFNLMSPIHNRALCVEDVVAAHLAMLGFRAE